MLDKTLKLSGKVLAHLTRDRMLPATYLPPRVFGFQEGRPKPSLAEVPALHLDRDSFCSSPTPNTNGIWIRVWYPFRLTCF